MHMFRFHGTQLTEESVSLLWGLQIWVETLVENSTYNLATSIGFVRCFLFISGGNSKNMEIEMTGPVHITPVLSEAGYKTGFFVPSRYTPPAMLCIYSLLHPLWQLIQS
jgi:hypothetical protein